MENDSKMVTWTLSEIIKLFTKIFNNVQESLQATCEFLQAKGSELVATGVPFLSKGNTLIILVVSILLFKSIFGKTRKEKIKRTDNSGNRITKPSDDLSTNWSVFDLAKTAYEPGHAQAAINVIEKLHYDVNSVIPSNGLTLFLCACLSGQKGLIKYMLVKGADVTRRTKAGDTALYLATFGILSTSEPDVTVLEELIQSGCDVNSANLAGYTPLHRAAGHGNLNVIQTLLKHGADPYQASCTGIYPIDSAINAGNLHAADLLKINLPNPYVWDVVEPHTPPHIKLGLQSPQRKHLIESTRKIMSPRIM
ncbi:ankyrin-3-like isoform X2 [Mercenaria mercenaria]|uniref:ankyrin-3-like isoform X2 n=1 Tax=Mercenaria mercenaria TaxID=6596 RepID=UPI00234E785D|nr:ankyrin-3-like isoform X2 [Mercenaria mercenaria]